MLALDRKLLRHLWRLKMQAAAIALVVASGVAMFVAMLVSIPRTREHAINGLYLRRSNTSIRATRVKRS